MRDPAALIDIADAADVSAFAAELGATPHQVCAASAILGRSVGALTRYFRERQSAAGRSTEDMYRHSHVRDLMELYSRRHVHPEQAAALAPKLLAAMGQVVRGIRQGSIRLDYLPPEGDIVFIPPADHPMHLQALLYWRIRLETSLPAIMEAVATVGPDASAEQVRQWLQERAKKR